MSAWDLALVGKQVWEMTKGKKKSDPVNALMAALQRVQIATPVVVKKKKKSRKRKRNGAAGSSTSVNSDAQINISRTEVIAVIKTDSTGGVTGHVDLIPDSFGFLKGLAKCFDRFRWDAFKVFYKPAVGSTIGGFVSVGMDWDFAGTDVARAKLSGYSPNFTTAAWTDTESRPMVFPSSRLQSRSWYMPNAGSSVAYVDKGPGKIHYAVESSAKSTTIGELWCSYRVTMAGTTPAL